MTKMEQQEIWNIQPARQMINEDNYSGFGQTAESDCSFES
jgi:hypothetical protein